jgi:hypothetical protein
VPFDEETDELVAVPPSRSTLTDRPARVEVEGTQTYIENVWLPAEAAVTVTYAIFESVVEDMVTASDATPEKSAVNDRTAEL